MIYPFNKKLRSNPRVRLYAGRIIPGLFDISGSSGDQP